MKWNRYFISMALLACSMYVMADDSINVQQTVESSYEKRLHRKEKAWASLIPTHFAIQNAGNMGVVSAGIGWSYGKRRQWETDLFFGYVPKHDSSRGKLTTTLKGNFIPWDINWTPKTASSDAGKWKFQPLTCSLYLNTVYGSEFWKSQPGSYPDDYYQFMSTKFRLNVAFGQRIMFQIPESKRKRHNRIALYYEVGTCDLYIRAMFQSSVPLKDILGLSIGMKFYTK